MDEGSELWAVTDCEYGAAVIIICGLWCTILGCMPPPAVAPWVAPVPERLEEIDSEVEICWGVRLAGGCGCS